MAQFFAFFTLFHLNLTFFRPGVPFKARESMGVFSTLLCFLLCFVAQGNEISDRVCDAQRCERIQFWLSWRYFGCHAIGWPKIWQIFILVL